MFLSAIVVFTVASLLCSTSTSLGELAAFRVLQGAGAAMMTPVGRLSVLARTAKSDLMRMISYIVWPALLAPVIAPLAGGVITTYGSWRWIFLINVPLGVVAFVVAVRIVPAVPPSAPPPLDLAGVALTALGLGGLAYAAGLISQNATPWALVAAVGLPALLALALAIRHLLRAENPLVDLRTLRIATFRVSVGSGALSTMAIAAVPFMLALLFQNVFGWSPVKSGAVVLFVFVGNIGIKPATSFIVSRWGFRRVLLAACLTLSASMVGAAFFTSATPIALIALTAVVSGIGRSIGGTSYNTLSYVDVPEATMPHANTLVATTQQLAAGLGVAAATLALRLGGTLDGRPGSGHIAGQLLDRLRVPGPAAAGGDAGVSRLRRDAGNVARRQPAAQTAAGRTGRRGRLTPATGPVKARPLLSAGVSAMPAACARADSDVPQARGMKKQSYRLRPPALLSPSARPGRCAAWTCTCARGPCTRSSGRTARARRPPSASLPPCCGRTHGSARVNGLDVVSQAGKVRESIGLTGQFASVDEDLTGTQNLVMIGQLLDLTKKEARARSAELLEWFDLTEAAGKVAKHYSGGMRRRLDLAASLVGRPSVIFLDEPTTGLDPAKREDMWDVVRRLISDGSTVLLTTQYLEEADALADEITVIDHGQVIAHDTPNGLKRVVGGQRLTVRAADPAREDDLRELLSQIGGTAPADEGRGTLTVPVDGEDVLPDVVSRLRAAGISVEELSLHLPSLDEVFFTLTGTRSAGDARTASEVTV